MMYLHKNQISKYSSYGRNSISEKSTTGDKNLIPISKLGDLASQPEELPAIG